MRLFDTHCHIADPRFDGDRDAVIQRFLDAGVRRALVVADPREPIYDGPEDEGGKLVAVGNEAKVFSIVEAHDFLYGAVGVHPHNASGWDAGAEATVREYLKHPRCRLLGEIGLDYHYDLSPRDVQRKVFDIQLDMAFDLGIPVQLHIREAHGDCLDIVRRCPEAHGVFHCYSGSKEMAEELLKRGWYLGFDGPITYKNARKAIEVLEICPLDRLLIETDSPYLSPVPRRGKRNDSRNLRYVVEKIAEVKGLSPEEVARAALENGRRLFNI